MKFGNKRHNFLKKRGFSEIVEIKCHYLKILSMFFEDALIGLKPFEIRLNDRDFQVGDLVWLLEIESGKYTGRMIFGKITYMTDYEQKDDYVVFTYETLGIIK